MLNINIKTIPHKNQRYDTCGDWWWDKGALQLRVSNLGNEYEEFAVAIHETIEAFHCKFRRITQKEVDAWDDIYEKWRNDPSVKMMTCGCRITKTSEPGADKHAPYYFQHRFATEIEKLIIKKFGIDWKEYDKRFSSL